MRLEQGQLGLQQGLLVLQQGHDGLQQGLLGLQQGHDGLQQGLLALQQGHDGLQQGLLGLKQDLLALQQGHDRLQQGHDRLQQGQRDIMARIDRLQDTVTAVQTDMSVNLGATHHVERREENTREEVRSLTTLVYAMERQIQHLQTEVRDLRGGA
jgi:chromosome segregation ATPase